MENHTEWEGMTRMSLQDGISQRNKADMCACREDEWQERAERNGG